MYRQDTCGQKSEQLQLRRNRHVTGSLVGQAAHASATQHPSTTSPCAPG